MLNKKRGSIFASSFFLYLFCFTSFASTKIDDSPYLANLALSLKLDEEPTWLALLHTRGGKPFILENDFLLSREEGFSPRNELIADLKAFSGEQRIQYYCRFPARYLFLQKHLNLPSIHSSSCPELFQFQNYAPADKISLVFASENITQPASMMGHIFLKISGKHDDGSTAEHAISYFTESKTLNIPKLIYQSTVTGKKGYFSLSPYQEKVDKYTKEEQRNLWEYELGLTQDQKQLIQFHIYELKQTKLTYFFQDYNCATLIEFIISTAIPNLQKKNRLWTTPAGLVKELTNTNFVKAQYLHPSTRWKLRLLESQMSTTDIMKAKAFDAMPTPHSQNANKNQQETFLTAAKNEYNNYLLEKNIQTEQAWNTNFKKINGELNDSYESIYLNRFKNPSDSPYDSQITFAVVEKSSQPYFRVSLLPASHSLEDNNQQYFGETGLHLASVDILTQVKTGATEIERFELYSIASFIPYDKLTGGLSGRFGIGVQPQFGQQLRSLKEAYISGALGYTYQITTDIDAYLIGGIGVGRTKEKTYLYEAPEFGLTVREIFNMKSSLSATQYYNSLGDGGVVNELVFTQAKYWNDSYAILFHLRQQQTQSVRHYSYDLGLRVYF